MMIQTIARSGGVSFIYIYIYKTNATIAPKIESATMTDIGNNVTLPLPTHVTIAPSSAPSITMTDQNSNNATLPLPTHVTIAPSSAPSITMTTTTNNNSISNSSTTPPTDGEYNEIVFVQKSSQNDTAAATTPIGYYTSCHENNNDTTIADIATTQIIEFQYVLTMTNTTATNTSMTTEDRGSDASVVVDTMIVSIETTLHDYLVPQLLQTCRTDQDDDNLQFYSVSSLPMDMATSSSSTSSSCVTTTSPTIFPCVMTIHGAMTLETFYPPRSANRRYLDDTTIFSDPILLERIGSLLVTFFNDTNHHLTAHPISNNTNDINSTFTTISNATNEYNNNIPLSLYHWNVTFLTITNFVSQDQPFLDTFTVNTNGRNNSNNNSNTASGIAIDQASSNQTTIDKSVGIIVVTMATTALLITLLMIAFRRRRRHHKQQRQTTSRTIHPNNNNNNDTTLSSERDGCENSNHNENTKNDDDDISFVLNDVMERDVESHANKVAPSRDWQVYHTTNDTPPMFISSFDDEGDMMSIVGTLPASDDDHRWI